MNEKINSDVKSLKLIFNRNRPYILPIVIILISMVLLFQFVIPQFSVLLAVRRDAQESLLKLEVLKGNLDVLANINDETLDAQLKILNSALPLNKDFIGVLNSLYSTAQKTGVSLGNFSFQVGDLSDPGGSDSFSTVKLSVPINSPIIAVNSFIDAMSKTVPLAEIYFVKTGISSSTVGLSFYYKPLGVSAYDQNIRMNPISQKGLDLINKLEDFGSASIPKPIIPSLPIATSSGQ